MTDFRQLTKEHQDFLDTNQYSKYVTPFVLSLLLLHLDSLFQEWYHKVRGDIREDLRQHGREDDN